MKDAALQKEEHEKESIIRLSRSDLYFKANYPKENPKGSIESITDALKHIGVFDGIRV